MTEVYTIRLCQPGQIAMRAERLEKLSAALHRRQHDLTLLAENTRKSHNIAAMLRTADAVGLLQLHAVSKHPVRHHHQISGGSRKWVRLQRHPTLSQACEVLKDEGFKLYAAHQSRRAIDFREVDYTEPCAIVVGGELWGVSATAAEIADEHILVPMKGLVSSLNVSVAAALVLYEAMRQREAAGLYDRSRLDPQHFSKLLFEWGYPRIARRCRELGQVYPTLRNDGSIADNPFTDDHA